MIEISGILAVGLYVRLGSILGMVGATSVGRTICNIGGAILMALAGALLGALYGVTTCVTGNAEGDVATVGLFFCATL